MNLFEGVRKKVSYKHGLVLFLDVSDWIQQNLYFLGSYEEKEIKFVEQYLAKGEVFIDVGANFGLFTLVGARIVGNEGRVYAFEPLGKNYHRLARHIFANGLTNVQPEKLAVSNKSELLQLYLDQGAQNYGMASLYAGVYTLSEEVPAASLDEYFAEKDVKHIRLVKLDIEGHELPALEGMKGILEKHKPALLIELDPGIQSRAGYSQQEAERFLTGLGYQQFFIDALGQLRKQKQADDYAFNCVFLHAGEASRLDALLHSTARPSRFKS